MVQYGRRGHVGADARGEFVFGIFVFLRQTRFFFSSCRGPCFCFRLDLLIITAFSCSGRWAFRFLCWWCSCKMLSRTISCSKFKGMNEKVCGHFSSTYIFVCVFVSGRKKWRARKKNNKKIATSTRTTTAGLEADDAPKRHEYGTALCSPSDPGPDPGRAASGVACPSKACRRHRRLQHRL